MTAAIRVDLVVPYVEKEDAKALGARWDVDRKVWYAPPGSDLQLLGRWLPRDFMPAQPAESDEAAEPERGTTLIDLLAQVRLAVEGALPEAVWVRAEISELRGKNGHLYPTLTQRNDRGDVLAQTSAAIWKGRATGITKKFVEATGEGLRTDIKILCLAKVRFDVLYGLDLIIEDIDPSFTLGDLAAKLRRIRERLTQERLYDLNKRLPAPVEFVRVAVISPETSAGLGDFRRETDRLQAAGLCDFAFYPTTFQGLDAPSSLRTAVNEVLAAHRRRPFDALVIIRGGGSVTDLAWLDDLELARLVCRCPIPIFTGIGHERDSTILDEVAHRRFDTPSKVALHITQTIRDNALGALAALEQIKLQVARIVTRERTALATQADRIGAGVRSLMQQAEEDQRRFLVMIRTATHFQLREAAQTLEVGSVRLIGVADQALHEADLQMRQSMDAIAHRSQLLLGQQRAAIEKAANTVAWQVTAKTGAAGRDLAHVKAQMERDAARLVTKAAEDLDCSLAAVAQGARGLVEAAHREIEASTRIVVGLGPQATLRRGFAIARDTEDRPLTTREAAMRCREFAVQFQDGTVPVAVRESREGVGP
jgi:exodeoxyribonuclease VII large subunit